jgi:hypothetical protein
LLGLRSALRAKHLPQRARIPAIAHIILEAAALAKGSINQAQQPCQIIAWLLRAILGLEIHWRGAYSTTPTSSKHIT